MSADVLEDIQAQRYMDRRHLSYQQYLDEPVEVIERAFLVWEMDDLRAKVKAERPAL